VADINHDLFACSVGFARRLGKRCDALRSLFYGVVTETLIVPVAGVCLESRAFLTRAHLVGARAPGFLAHLHDHNGGHSGKP